MNLRISDLLAASLLFSSFSSGLPHLLISAMLFIVCKGWRRECFKLNHTVLAPFYIFFVCSFVTFLSAINIDPAVEEVSLLRMRKFLFECMVAFLSIPYLKMLTPGRLYKIGLIGMSITSISLILQFTYGYGRAGGLYLEPSASVPYISIFLIFSAVLAKPALMRISILNLFLLQSKALFAVSALALARYNRIILAVMLIVLLYAYHEFTRGNVVSIQLHGAFVLLTTAMEHGLLGSDSTMGIFDTYLTRGTSIGIALLAIIDYPFGLGYGGFHEYYSQNIVGFYTFEQLGAEVNNVLQSGMMTPKSVLLEQAVSGGALVIFIYVWWIKNMWMYLNSSGKLMIIIFSTSVFLTELSNLFFLMILVRVILNYENFRRDSSEGLLARNTKYW